MTNKKAVEIIETFTANIFTEELEVIRKDLEILELLKSKHVDIAELKEDDNVKIYNMSMMKQDQLSEEEFKLLKEWLEND